MQKPKLFSIIKHRDKELNAKIITKDIIAGIIVAIIALPLSVALGISSGVTPEKGLVTAIIAGFLISFLGGSRVQIGGPTGAFVVIVAGIIGEYGIGGLTIATFMAGILLILMGFLNLGSVIKYIPYPITTGFTAGIAVTLFSTQIKDLMGLTMEEVPSEFFEKWGAYFSHMGTTNLTALAVGILSVAIIALWPKFNKTIPGSLVALLSATAAVTIFKLPVETIGSRFGEISGKISLVDFGSLDFSIENLRRLFAPALTIAMLAGIESLLSAVVADNMIGKKHLSNTELVAQGVANIGTALFGGIPATGAIARTAANVRNGGRTPIAGCVHAITLFFIMILFMPYAKLIPMTALSAILIVVAYNMSEWRSFRALLKSTKSDISVLLVTFLLTVAFDLVVAIEAGFVIAMFLFVKRMADSAEVETVTPQFAAMLKPKTEEDDGEQFSSQDQRIQVYEINGPFFFGAVTRFMEAMNGLHSKTKVLILRMKNVPIMDATANDAIERIEKRCRGRGITMMISELQEQPKGLLIKSGFLSEEMQRLATYDHIDKALLAAQGLLEQEAASV